MEKRLCKYCHEIKSGIDFFPYRKRKCKECCREYDRKRYPSRAKYLNDYWKEYIKDDESKKRHTERGARCASRWSKNNREKVAAEQKISHRVRAGKIRRPTKCTCCKLEAKTEAHHPNYDKPYFVYWLCRTCHKRYHSGKIDILKMKIKPFDYSALFSS